MTTVLAKIDNAGGSEPMVLVKCVVILLQVTLLQQKHLGKYLKFKVGPLTITERLFTLWDAKFVIILPMLEKLKQSFVFGLMIIKANTDLLEKGKQNVPQKCSHSHTIYSRLSQRYF